MGKPLCVRAVTQSEQKQLQAGLRGCDAFSLRRAQIIGSSARGIAVQEISQQVGCCVQTVRNVIYAFNQEGVTCLQQRSTRPKSTTPLLNEGKREQLQHLLHQSPRTFGKNTSLWTLQLMAEVAAEQGLTEHIVSDETIRRALHRLQVGWRRAKHWISSPDPHYALKKSGESG
jgi:transposase